MEVNVYYLNDFQKELNLSYDYINSPFGKVLLMLFENKICYLGFVDQNYHSKEEVLEIAKKSFRTLSKKNIKVHFIKDDLSSEKEIFLQNSANPKDIILIGTAFQINVWKALLSVKFGQSISYEDLSKKLQNIEIGKNYTRATANAVANNKISYIVPCHRIIKKNGSIHKYLWGVEIKKKILKQEGVEF